MAFFNNTSSFNSNWDNCQIPQKCSNLSFKRKERKSILINQEYLDLRANFISAEKILKDILDECASLKHQQNESQEAYKVAKSELSKIATEKAILEVENNEVGDEFCERYKQVKISFITAKQRCEILESKFVSGQEEAKQNLELAKEALKVFLCAHEEDLIIEKKELETELEEAKEFYGFKKPPKFYEYGLRNKTLKPILDDLNQIEEILSLVCDGSHLYTRISIYCGVENFRCKRCGKEYIHTLPALWND